MHPAALDPDELERACRMRRARRSGPGGQHRNKVESAVVWTHVATGITGEASERRSQHENRQVALFRLRVNLALEVRGERAAADVPSARWRAHAGGGRVAVNPAHSDFPALLAEALDVLAAHAYDFPHAAAALQTTSTQLVRLLGLEPRALDLANERRARLGLRKLRP